MSSSVDENRPAALVAFTASGSGAGAALQATIRAIQASVGLHHGTIVRAGDGAEPSIADFRDASRAFAFAREVLRMAARYNERHVGAPIDVRLGIHCDTVWFVGEEAIGDALAVAAHLAGMAAPGAVCASADALSWLGNASAWDLGERGAASVPGVDREVTVLDARPRAAASLADNGLPAQGRLPPRGEAPQPSIADAQRPDRPAWMNVPLPPRPPSARSPGQDILAGLTEIGRAVVNELADRSKGITEEKVRAAIRKSTMVSGDRFRYRWQEGEEDGSDPGSDPGDAGQDLAAEVSADFLQQRKKKIAAKAGRAVAGFVSHATTFALVGGGIVALNLFVAPGFPWAFFPVAGWGIGMVCHFRSMLSARRRARQIRALEAVSPEQLGLVEKIQRAERSFGGHTAAYLAVNGFLAGINLITSPGFLWFLFPALAWGIGYTIHWTGFLARKVALVRRLSDAGLSWGDVRSGRRVSGGHAAASGASLVAPGMEFADLVAEARVIRDGLLRELAAHEDVGKRMGSDVTELLTTYSEQLEKLVLRNHEFRTTLKSLPEAELEREIADYRAKALSGGADTLGQEYGKAAEQGERQLKSVRELKRQKEILGVRIRSAFGLLKQLELDFVRLKSSASSDDLQGLASIRSKAHEISDYLEGLDEVEREQ